MPLSRSIFSATWRPVKPLERGTVLYFLNLLFRTSDTTILIPKKSSETSIIEDVIFYIFLLFIPHLYQICNHLPFANFYRRFDTRKKKFSASCDGLRSN